MNVADLHPIIQSWGFKVKEEHQKPFENYVQAMLQRERFILIWDKSALQAIVFFYLTFDYEKLFKKSNWEIAEDSPRGDQIYIDKMICRRWTRGLREAIKMAFERKFPAAVAGFYHRAPKDRCVKILTEYGKSEAFLWPQF